jgi:hypothetical protein
MAVFLNNGVVLTVNAVDLSDHVTAVTINRSFDELEVTAMGDSGVMLDQQHNRHQWFSCRSKPAKSDI